jgi:hypothetical protein
VADVLYLDLSPEDRKGLGGTLLAALVSDGALGQHMSVERCEHLSRVLADAAVDYLDVADPDDEGGE